MAAITKNVNIGEFIDDSQALFPCDAGVRIYRGSLVGMNPATGYVGPFASVLYTTFVGIALHEANNTNGTAGDTTVLDSDGNQTKRGTLLCRVKGFWRFTAAAVNLTDVGKPFSAIDSSNTVQIDTGVSAASIGRVVTRLSATEFIGNLLGRIWGIGNNGG